MVTIARGHAFEALCYSPILWTMEKLTFKCR